MIQSELLQKGVEYDLIDVDRLADQVDQMDKREIMRLHSQKIWQGTNGYWYTYLISNIGERRLIKKKTEEELVKEVILHYQHLDKKYQTLESLFSTWILKKSEYGELKKQSVTRYTNNFNEFYGDVKDVSLNDISETWLEDYIKRKLRELVPPQRTWCNVKTITNGMFKYARKNKLTRINISDFFEMLEVSRSVIRKPDMDCEEQVFTDTEVDLITQECEKDGSLTALGVEFAAYTGIRAGELVSMKFSDVHGSIITVQRTEIRYKDSGGKVVYGIQEFTKGRDGVRKLILVPDALEVLKKLKEKSDTDYIFLDKIHSTAFTSKLYRICDKLGIRRRSLHKLRKTYATKLLDANIPKSVIISQLGHTAIETTEKFYYFNNHNLDEAKELIYNAFC